MKTEQAYSWAMKAELWLSTKGSMVGRWISAKLIFLLWYHVDYLGFWYFLPCMFSIELHQICTNCRKSEKREELIFSLGHLYLPHKKKSKKKKLKNQATWLTRKKDSITNISQLEILHIACVFFQRIDCSSGRLAMMA